MRNPYEILKNVRMTEKATALTEKNGQYVFVVDPSATKIEIKHAVETVFKKKVKSVNTINVLGKKKRERRADFGKKPDWKKAIVTLQEGESISFV